MVIATRVLFHHRLEVNLQMADFIGWLTDVFDLSFTVGAVTTTLGYITVAGIVVMRALRALRGLR